MGRKKFHHLPDEIIDAVFSSLDPTSAAHLAQTSHAMHTLFKSPFPGAKAMGIYCPPEISFNTFLTDIVAAITRFNTLSEDEKTQALFDAVYAGNVTLTIAALKAGANTRFCSLLPKTDITSQFLCFSDLPTPLHVAACFGHEVLTRVLLKVGHANPNACCDCSELTPLLLAVAHGQSLSCVKALVTAKANPHQIISALASDENTPAKYAAKYFPGSPITTLLNSIPHPGQADTSMLSR